MHITPYYSKVGVAYVEQTILCEYIAISFCYKLSANVKGGTCLSPVVPDLGPCLEIRFGPLDVKFENFRRQRVKTDKRRN